MKAMTKEWFKERWEGDENGGGITFEDIADCAVAWGIFTQPKTEPILLVRYLVLKAASVSDAESFNPATIDQEL